MAPGLSQNQSWFSVSQQTRGKEGRLLHWHSASQRERLMLKALVSWEEDALAVSRGLGIGLLGCSYHLVSKWQHIRALEDPTISYNHSQ